MTANSPSLQTCRLKLQDGMKWAFQAGHRQGRRLGCFARKTVWPWCADHLLSLAMLLAVPLGIGAYYWGTLSASSSASEEVLPFDQNQTAEVESVPPTGRSAYEPIQPPREDWPAGETISTAAEHPEEMRELWNPPPAPAENSSVQNCVWLTGTIEEPPDIKPNRVQYASQEQDGSRSAHR